MSFNPLSIIPGGVNVVIKDVGTVWQPDFIAKCERIYDSQPFRCPSEQRYVIHLNLGLISSKCAGDKVLIKHVTDALILHEVSHISENSFDASVGIASGNRDKTTLHMIHNILEDRRVEYRTQVKYPVTTNLFNLLNRVFKSATESKQLTPTQQYLDNLFKFVIYDEIPTEHDGIEFTTMLLPIAEIIKNSDSKQTLTLSQLIYDYIDYKIDISVAEAQKYKDERVKQLYKQKVDESDTVIRDIIENITQTNTDDGGTPQITEGQQRMKKQIAKIRPTVIDMTKTFRLFFEHINQSETTDGEINFNKQQQAYIDSIIGDDNVNYIETKQSYDIKFDFVLLKDISGSIRTNKEVYYNSTLSILTALDKFPNVRTACIEFDDNAKVVKDFKQRVSESTLSYDVEYGTDMSKAIDLLKNIKFENENRLIIALTDGDTQGLSICMREKKKYQDEGHIFVVIHVGHGSFQDALVDKQTTFQDLNMTLYKEIYEYIKKLRRKNVIYG